MEAVRFDALTERVNRLERENRLIKRAALAVVAVAGLVVAFGAQKPEQKKPAQPNDAIPSVLKAGAFALVDKEGKVRASLTTDDDTTRLRFLNKLGKVRFMVSTDGDDRAALLLNDRDGDSRIALTMLENSGGAAIELCSKKGEMRVGLGHQDARFAGLLINDDNNKLRVEAVVRQQEGPMIRLRDGAGNTQFEVPRRQAPAVGLRSQNVRNRTE